MSVLFIGRLGPQQKGIRRLISIRVNVSSWCLALREEKTNITDGYTQKTHTVRQRGERERERERERVISDFNYLDFKCALSILPTSVKYDHLRDGFRFQRVARRRIMANLARC